jgi:DNA-binding NarL/FixJ family response regulator
MVRDDGAGPIRVLIADNDPRVRAALRTFLCAHRGFEVVGEAGCSAAAVAMAREHVPTVALVDVYLPEKSDGLALLRVLTDELRIPVLAISLEGGAREGALEAGAYRFLDKTSVPEHLLAALQQSEDHTP